MRNIVREFREFISRGNVVDLAVAVVIGAAFTAVVNSFANDILMQVIGAIFGKPDFNTLSFALNDSEIYFGRFLTVLIQFLIVAVAVFLIVKGINTLQRLRRTQEEATPAELTEIELLTQIRDALVRDERP
jgi:large conductance mechanosensitive channel